MGNRAPRKDGHATNRRKIVKPRLRICSDIGTIRAAKVFVGSPLSVRTERRQRIELTLCVRLG